jgi:predicted transcriptional regulator
LEGIVEWWLLEQEIKRRTAAVQEALAELLARGLVQERKGRDGRMHYRLNRRKLAEIIALLKQRAK